MRYSLAFVTRKWGTHHSSTALFPPRNCSGFLDFVSDISAVWHYTWNGSSNWDHEPTGLSRITSSIFLAVLLHVVPRDTIGAKNTGSSWMARCSPALCCLRSQGPAYSLGARSVRLLSALSHTGVCLPLLSKLNKIVRDGQDLGSIP